MKNYMILSLVFLILSCGKVKEETKLKSVENSNTKQVLLVGTFHYNNPGADVAKTKTFDILKESSQLELEKLSNYIKAYNPTKIFVEWPFDEQKELDSLYRLYKEDKYFENDSLSDFYLKNEIFQFAFRIAKKNNLDKVYGIDYDKTDFPYGKVMNDIEDNNQTELKEKIENTIANLSQDFDNMINNDASLTELTLALNTKEINFASNNLHNNLISMAGSPNDLNGVYLTSEWYKRNLYMWSLIQKNTLESDKKIMVLAGSSHTAMIELFINGNKNWETKELKEIIDVK